ncbi:PREDICTED: reticulon-4-interacting protein 1, mitochondrial [Dinoponera quadriceps]|uniref:Reticulon-4-interacting protein 1, mitochondrial n=1 Tax=Dinoponera quadriceps TaxID=609295 RepID=A0A6P3Y0B4_DINQU|nr:PREDICTED: reticulon-4-interacting protein 1, mitochondrial [Dinoponera quadriceps]
MLCKTIPKLKCTARLAQFRFLTKPAGRRKDNPEVKMQAWKIHSYDGPSELQLTNVSIPIIRSPKDVLVKVEAASVNPIDIAMTNGYGASLLNLMRKTNCSRAYDELELPLTLGRDFAGVVVSKGYNVGDKLEIGEEVWGVVPLDQQGCHANYVVVNSNVVRSRPRRLSNTEAASILYAGLTAWSALWYTGGLCYKTLLATRRRRVLVMGGSGGVGTIAIQLLKAWNTHVISTCSGDAVETLQSLGADVVIDYKQDDADRQIISEGPYDIILDCAKQGPELVRKKGYPCDTYVTLNSPMLRNFDQYGLIMGTIQNLGDIARLNIPIAQNKGCVKWGFFVPDQTGMNVLQGLVESGRIVPVIQEVYPFEDLPLAFERAKQGHLRGKLVIDVKSARDD